MSNRVEWTDILARSAYIKRTVERTSIPINGVLVECDQMPCPSLFFYRILLEFENKERYSKHMKRKLFINCSIAQGD